jgi:hypothetical protein
MIMSESWRDILEKASANLSIELRRRVPQNRPSVQRAQPPAPARSHSVAKAHEARALPERELEALDAITARSRRDDRPASVLHTRHEPNNQPRGFSENHRPASPVDAPVFEQKTVLRASLLTAINATVPVAPAVKVMPTPQWRMKLSKRHLWRSAIAISVSAIFLGLTAQTLYNRSGRVAGVTMQATPAILSHADPVSIPLPSRGPAARQRGEQGRDRAGPATWAIETRRYAVSALALKLLVHRQKERQRLSRVFIHPNFEATKELLVFGLFPFVLPCVVLLCDPLLILSQRVGPGHIIGKWRLIISQIIG